LESLLLVAILLIAAFTFSFAGFGFSMVAVPLLALLYPTSEAVAFQFFYALCVVVYHAFRFRGQVVWKLFWPMVAGAVAFMPVGAYALQAVPDGLLKKSLAVFLLLAVLVNRTAWGKKASAVFRSSFAWGVVWGALSGLFQGAYTTGGPPAVIYVRAAVPDPAAGKGILGMYFSLLYCFMLPLFIFSGIFNQELLIKAAWCSPAVVAGTVAGALAFKRASVEGYRFFVDFLLLVTAVLLWARA